MPRHSRLLNSAGIYHIMLRGNERKEIFLDDDDRKRFINTVAEKTLEENSAVYAYCLMDNHVHLLLGRINDNLARLMKRITVSYVFYFNHKYKRIGHLFHDRFRSENIDNDAYLLEAVRYIHNNPVKAAMVKSPLEYPWSSYQHYLKDSNLTNIESTDILNLFSKVHEKAVWKFIEYSSKFSDFQLTESRQETNEEERIHLENLSRVEFSDILKAKNHSVESLKLKEHSDLRKELISHLKTKYNLSVRQMSSVTGINRGVILKIYQQNNLVNKNRPR